MPSKNSPLFVEKYRVAARLLKEAASKKTAPYQQTRKGRRPIRVHNLLKKAQPKKAPWYKKPYSAKYHGRFAPKDNTTLSRALLGKFGSPGGQDLRLPVMGGTKFPTNDSLSSAKQTLKKHQSIGVPELPKTKDIAETIPKAPGSLNLMPKVSSTMTTLSDDPLVQFLARQEREKRAMIMDDNEESMPTGAEHQELQSRPPEAPAELVTKAKSQWSDKVREALEHRAGKKKYLDKDHPATAGQVDKRLRSA